MNTLFLARRELQGPLQVIEGPLTALITSWG